MSSALSPEQSRFIEEMAFIFAGFGLPPMTGRIFGWLLLCQPTEQSAAAIGDTLNASKGSVSTSLKALMAGATGVQLVSALLKGGPKALAAVKSELEQWLVAHEYESLQQAIGSMSLANSPDPEAFERANYMKSLLTYS